MRTVLAARVTQSILAATALFATPLGACASEPKPRPMTIDPSNPEGPEGARLTVAALNEPAPAAPPASAPTPEHAAPVSPDPAAEHGHDHGAKAPKAKKDKSAEGSKSEKPAATTYTCPMHPEVASDKPGRCPQCGMNLVPKQPAEGKK